MCARFSLALLLLFLLLPPPPLLCDKSTQNILQFVRRAKTAGQPGSQADKDNKGVNALKFVPRTHRMSVIVRVYWEGIGQDG